MKKVIFGATAALALAVVFTGVVSAHDGGDHHRSRGDVTSIKNDRTIVLTVATSRADTGDNIQMGSGGSMAMMHRYHHGSSASPTQRMITGNATSKADAYADVNSTYLPSCGCWVPGGSETKVRNTRTLVGTVALSEAETGDNTQMSSSQDYRPVPYFQSFGEQRPTMGGDSRQLMRTGNANSQGYATSYVNMTNMAMTVNPS